MKKKEEYRMTIARIVGNCGHSNKSKRLDCQERASLFEHGKRQLQILKASQGREAALVDNPEHIRGTEPGNPQERLPGSPLDREREKLRVGLCPNKLRIPIKTEISLFGEQQVFIGEPILP